jgi:uncharacterized cupin superfamily protein
MGSELGAMSAAVTNVRSIECEPDSTDPAGLRSRNRRLGPLLEAQRLGATVYQLDPGQSICPYHYELAEEEWLLVIEGRPTLRHPAGEDVVRPGDLVCFPCGPEGAHKLTNNTDADVRLMIFSNIAVPAVTVYPDSGKVGVWPPNLLFRAADAVDYWDGELDG